MMDLSALSDKRVQDLNEHPLGWPSYRWHAGETDNEIIHHIGAAIRDNRPLNLSQFGYSALDTDAVVSHIKQSQDAVRQLNPTYDPDTDTVLLHRGMKREGSPGVQSWSTKLDVAQGFGGGKDVHSVRHPVAHIITTHHTNPFIGDESGEAEYLLTPQRQDIAKAEDGAVYYHGTKGENLREAAKTGFLNPGNPEGARRGYLAPLKGQTYATSDPGYALIYGINGNMVGHPTWNDRLHPEAGMAIVKPDRNKLVPDEDWLGEVMMSGMDESGDAHPLFDELLNHPALDAIWDKVDQTPRHKRYEMATHARFGKQAVRALKGTPMLRRLVAASPHVAHDGPLPIERAFVINAKEHNSKLKRDGSNWMDYAEEIPVGNSAIAKADEPIQWTEDFSQIAETIPKAFAKKPLDITGSSKTLNRWTNPYESAPRIHRAMAAAAEAGHTNAPVYHDDGGKGHLKFHADVGNVVEALPSDDPRLRAIGHLTGTIPWNSPNGIAWEMRTSHDWDKAPDGVPPEHIQTAAKLRAFDNHIPAERWRTKRFNQHGVEYDTTDNAFHSRNPEFDIRQAVSSPRLRTYQMPDGSEVSKTHGNWNTMDHVRSELGYEVPKRLTHSDGKSVYVKVQNPEEFALHGKVLSALRSDPQDFWEEDRRVSPEIQRVLGEVEAGNVIDSDTDEPYNSLRDFLHSNGLDTGWEDYEFNQHGLPYNRENPPPYANDGAFYDAPTGHGVASDIFVVRNAKGEPLYHIKRDTQFGSLDGAENGFNVFSAMGYTTPDVHRGPNRELIMSHVEVPPGVRAKPTEENKRAVAMRVLMGDSDGTIDNWLVDRWGSLIPIDMDGAGHDTDYDGAKYPREVFPGGHEEFLEYLRDVAGDSHFVNLVDQHFGDPELVRSIRRAAGGVFKTALSMHTEAMPDIQKSDEDDIIVYHRTTPDAAKRIRQTGRFQSRENTGEVFVSNRQSGHASGYGDAVVPLKVPMSLLRLDDEFPDGEQHFAVNGKHLNSTHIMPSDVQKSVDKTVEVAGLTIHIENPKGTVRTGVDDDGTPWEIRMKNDYGELKGTDGADGDPVDVFLGDGPTEKVFVVNQVKQKPDENGKYPFDEHKVMLGFEDEASAKAAYLANYDDGWKCGPIKTMPLTEFKKWLKSDHTTRIAKAMMDEPVTMAIQKMTKSDEESPAWELEGDFRDFIENLESKYPGTDIIAHKVEGMPYIAVNRLYVPKTNRGQGIGSAIMREIHDHVDRQGYGSYLTPEPMGKDGPSKSKLTEWYSSMGYVPNKGRVKDYAAPRESMVRLPKTDISKAAVNAPVTMLRKGEGNLPDFHHSGVSKADEPGALQTGVPVTLPYLHRKTMPPTPDMGERFNQHLEPHGEYMTAHPQVKLPSIVGKPGSATGVTANEYGDVTFKNPLVIRARPDEYIEWKRDLSIEHGGRVGEALSDRLRSLGHDGIIVTHDGVTPGEMVNLGGIKKVTQEGGKLPKLDHGAADHDKDIWVVHDTEGL